MTGPLANYWLHAGYLNIEQQKMSKSLGNVLTVRHLLEEYDPLDLRFFLLSAHYRKPLNFSRELIRQARSGRERLQEFLENLQDALEKGEGGGEPGRLGAALEKARERFLQAMDDDFNTADGIAALFELAREGTATLRKTTLTMPDFLKMSSPFTGKSTRSWRSLPLIPGKPWQKRSGRPSGSGRRPAAGKTGLRRTGSGRSCWKRALSWRTRPTAYAGNAVLEAKKLAAVFSSQEREVVPLGLH